MDITMLFVKYPLKELPDKIFLKVTRQATFVSILTLNKANIENSIYVDT